MPALQTAPLFDRSANGGIDIKEELLRMNQELLISFQELLTVLVNQPGGAPQLVTDISSLLRQMQYLLNLLRPHQAYATLAHSLQTGIQQRVEAVAHLKQQATNAQQTMQACAVKSRQANGLSS